MTNPANGYPRAVGRGLQLTLDYLYFTQLSEFHSWVSHVCLISFSNSKIRPHPPTICFSLDVA